jgi:hypothetical protein
LTTATLYRINSKSPINAWVCALSNVEPNEILELSAARFGIQPEAMSGPVGRSSNEAFARAVTAFLVRKHTPASIPDIGGLIGVSDESLVRRLIKRGEQWARGDEPVCILAELVELDIDRVHTERLLPASYISSRFVPNSDNGAVPLQPQST